MLRYEHLVDLSLLLLLLLYNSFLTPLIKAFSYTSLFETWTDCDECFVAGDEAIIAMSVAGEVTDTSIVEIGRSRPQFQYSRVSLITDNIYIL